MCHVIVWPPALLVVLNTLVQLHAARVCTHASTIPLGMRASQNATLRQMGVSLQVLGCMLLQSTTVPASLGQAVLMMAAEKRCPRNLTLRPMDTADLMGITCKCMAISSCCIIPQKQVHLGRSVLLPTIAFLPYKAITVLMMLLLRFVCTGITCHILSRHVHHTTCTSSIPMSQLYPSCM